MSAGVKLAIGATVIVGVTLYMAYVGASSSWKYYVTAEEYLANPQAFAGQQLRVSGKVAKGSLEVSRVRGDGRFSLAADARLLAVECHCMLPDNLAEGVEVVVEGWIDERGVLRGDKVLTRCASKYAAGTADDKVAATGRLDAEEAISAAPAVLPENPSLRRSPFTRSKPGVSNREMP